MSLCRCESMAAYESFGDVVMFDRTYLNNRYGMPFTPFIGVNYHGQSVLFGWALLSNEDADSFVWLFESSLACTSSRSPKDIVSNQCKAMKKAIEIVFPDARHWWCQWHITKRLPGKLSSILGKKQLNFCTDCGIRLFNWKWIWRHVGKDADKVWSIR